VVLAALNQVDKWYGEQTVLEGVTLELREGERLALIGRNGAGKTTVLRLFAATEPPDGGGVYRRPGVSVGLLDQAPTFPRGATVISVADRAFGELDALERELHACERGGLDDPDTYARWEAVHEVFERRGGYARRARRDAVLHALGFARRGDDPVAGLSGGELTRLGLARLLMAQPDVALLDEPTNHLDIEMRAWLEGFLVRYPGAAVVVSHDRAFLDAACDRTAEVRHAQLRILDVTPTAFRASEAERRRIEDATRANEAREHARLLAAADQMARWAGQNAKLARRAKAIERRAERFAADMLDDEPPDLRGVRFTFPAPPSGEVVLVTRHLGARFTQPLFDDVAVTVRRGERVALVGPNGAGKTTFLRVLLGEQPSRDPRASVHWGARVRVAYYDQSLARFDPDANLLETLVRLVGERRAHDLLGRFLFPFDAQFKRVGDLSGGERARLALLQLTLEDGNVLVLDEPTNHLDMEMIEALEAALATYEGTLIMVSHDRRLLERLSSRVWEIDDGVFEDYEGDWGYYRRQRPRRRGQPDAARPLDERAPSTDGPGSEQAEGPPANTDDQRSTWQLERERERLEGAVSRLEAALEAARREVDALSAAASDDHVRLAEAGERFERCERELLDAMEGWARVDEVLRRRGR
jgi:ATP-binding cassette, subfamily F, member 3